MRLFDSHSDCDQANCAHTESCLLPKGQLFRMRLLLQCCFHHVSVVLVAACELSCPTQVCQFSIRALLKYRAQVKELRISWEETNRLIQVRESSILITVFRMALATLSIRRSFE